MTIKQWKIEVTQTFVLLKWLAEHSTLSFSVFSVFHHYCDICQIFCEESTISRTEFQGFSKVLLIHKILRSGNP